MLKANYFLADQEVYSSVDSQSDPVVSVVLPTFRRADEGLLERAIRSVLDQTFEDLELIVVDDGSVDSTQQVVRRLLSQDRRLRYVRHSLNSGLPALRVNEGVALARGKYIAYQFDDDQWTPEALSHLKAALDEQERPALVFGQCLYREHGAEYLLGQSVSFQSLTLQNRFANNAVLHHKSLFERLGGYDMHIAMRRLCDWDLWLRWIAHVPFVFVEACVSIVDASQKGSLALTVPFDLSIFRAVNAFARRDQLKLSTCFEQQVDASFNFASADTPLGRAVEQQIAEYGARRRGLPTSFSYAPERPANLIVINPSRDTNQDIMFFNHAGAFNGGVIEFIPSDQFQPSRERHADNVLFVRTLDEGSGQLLDEVNRTRAASVYVLDDDLLHFYDMDASFGYLQAGHRVREEMTRQISAADACFVYSDLIRASVNDYNPRTVQLDTNIRQHWLPSRAPARTGGKLRIGFAGGGARTVEFELLWDGIVAAARRSEVPLEFVFFGFEPQRSHELPCNVRLIPFSQSYYHYLATLRELEFDIMIAPLLGDKRAKRAKCPIKFLEITAAGAVGIYSDVDPYNVVEDGKTGLKTANTAEAWEAALLRAIALGASARAELVDHALGMVRRRFSSESLHPQFRAAVAAADFHSRTRHLRSETGQPIVALFVHSAWLGGAESGMLRHALLLKRFGILPILVLPAAFEPSRHELQIEAERLCIEVAYLPLEPQTEPVAHPVDPEVVNVIERWLRERNVAVAHVVTLMLAVSMAARRASVPVVGYVFQFESIDCHPTFRGYADLILSDSLFYAHRWGNVLSVPSACLRGRVPDAFFQLGISRLFERVARRREDTPLRIGVIGTVQPRKGQLNVVRAAAILRQRGIQVSVDFLGYTTFYPDYLEECRAEVAKEGLYEQVSFHGFTRDSPLLLQDFDVLLCASEQESLPQTVQEAMACGIFVISTDVGAIAEVIGETTGILLPDNRPQTLAVGIARYLVFSDDERSTRLQTAFDIARRENSDDVVAEHLLGAYCEVLARRESEPSRPLAAVEPRSHLEELQDGRRLKGWAYGSDSEMPSLLEIYADGVLIGMCWADLHRGDLEAAGMGDGCCAFMFELPVHLLDGKPHLFDVRFARTSNSLSRAPQLFTTAAASWLRRRFSAYSGS